MKKLFLAALLLTFITSGLAYAHSGRTNSSGCHTDRSTGIYHCH